MVMDGSAKEKLHGSDFHFKCHEANCHLKQTEPYSPAWQNTAERAICENINAYMNELISALTAYGHKEYKSIEYHLLQAFNNCAKPASHYLMKIMDGEHKIGFEQLKTSWFKIKKGEWNSPR
jgi:hypothetical protein